MPFDYDDYQVKVNTLTTEELHKEWENYTRQIAGGATSTATSVLFSPLTAGISLVGLGLSAPRIHNARKKRDIIEAGLRARGTTHNTRKRDVIAPMAVAGTIGGLTLGLAGPGADMIAGEAVGHGVEYAVSHTALDATGAIIEHTHNEHSKKMASQKLNVQYQSFQQQYLQEHEKIYGANSRVSHTAPAISQNNLQTSAQDYKYEYVPVSGALLNDIPQSLPQPLPHSAVQHPLQYQPLSSYPEQLQSSEAQSQIMHHPISNQQHLDGHSPQTQSIVQSSNLSVTDLGSSPALTPTFTAQAGPIDASYFPEKSEAYVKSIPKLGQDLPIDAESSEETAVADVLPVLSMDEEIALLKFKLLQLELEKREETLEAPPLTNEKPETQPLRAYEGQEIAIISTNNEASLADPGLEGFAKPNLLISPPLITHYTQQQSFPPPPVSSALPSRSPSVYRPSPVYPPPPSSLALPPRLSNLSTTHYIAQPQLTSNKQTHSYPLPSPSTYNPQHYQSSLSIQQYPPQSKSSNLQQQPQIYRNDSGYYSGAPTPLISAQSTGQYFHGNNASQASLSPLSPPPPYLPPPPVMSLGGKTDLVQQNPPYPSGYPANSPSLYQGAQGWVWGAPRPVAGVAEPDYGPPPPIPTAWRGS